MGRVHGLLRPVEVSASRVYAPENLAFEKLRPLPLSFLKSFDLEYGILVLSKAWWPDWLYPLGEVKMQVLTVIPQMRTTDFRASIRFYTEKLGFALVFNFDDFYAGIRAGDQLFHLKRVDHTDPSIAFVDEGDHLHLYFGVPDAQAAAEELKTRGVSLLKDVHHTAWQTREFIIQDDQGHTLYFGEDLSGK